jgi:hypothetical protein
VGYSSNTSDCIWDVTHSNLVCNTECSLSNFSRLSTFSPGKLRDEFYALCFVAQQILVGVYRRFGTACLSNFEGLKNFLVLSTNAAWKHKWAKASFTPWRKPGISQSRDICTGYSTTGTFHILSNLLICTLIIIIPVDTISSEIIIASLDRT